MEKLAARRRGQMYLDRLTFGGGGGACGAGEAGSVAIDDNCCWDVCLLQVTTIGFFKCFFGIIEHESIHHDFKNKKGVVAYFVLGLFFISSLFITY